MATRKMDETRVVISADDSKLQSVLKRAQARVAAFGARIKSATGTLTRFGTIAAAGAAAGLVVLMKRSLEAIDNIGKLSSRLGFATESLGRLEHLSNIAGVGFTAMAKAVQTAQRQVSEAANGNKTYQDSLTELGLSAQNLINKSPEEMLFSLLAAMDKVENKTRRVGLAYDFFGARGTAMLQVLEGGVDAMRQTINEADALGLAMTGGAVKGVEQANDAMARLQGLFTGVVRQITAAFAPAIEKLADLFKNKLLVAIKENGGSVETWARNTVLNVLKMVGEVAFAIERFILKALQATAKLRTQFGMSTDGFAETQKDILQFFDGLINQLAWMGAEVKKGLGASGVGITSGPAQSADKATLGGAALVADNIMTSFRTLALDVRSPIKSIGQAIENTFIGAANKIFSEVIGNILSDAMGSILGKTAIGGLMGFATGGGVNAGQPIVVGEHGKELFVPQSAGAIRNTHDTRNMAGGKSVVVNNYYTFDNTYSPNHRAMIENTIESTRPATVAATLKAITQGA